jgi:ribonuclease HI
MSSGGPNHYGMGNMSIARDMIKEPILQMGTDKMITRYIFHKPFTVKLTNRSEWDRGLVPIQQGGLIGYTDGSKTNEGTGAGVYGHGMRQKFSFSLGRYTKVFQAEVYAIKACADENIKRGFHNRNIYILSDSQAAIKALDSCKIVRSRRLVWDCFQSLMTLAVRNKVYLMWVLGHKGIYGNKTADQLAKMGSLRPFIGPEPACGISGNVARRAIRDWVCREHHKYWQSILGQRHAKGFLDRPSAKRTAELLKLSRFQIKQVTVLLTGHCHLRGHLFKLGKLSSPNCRRCYHETETASHVLCDCEALADLRFRHLGRFFLKPGDYHEILLSRILCFIARTGLLAD